MLLTVGLVPAIRHSAEAMRLDSRGIDIAGRGAIPWEAVNCEVIPGILGSMLVVIPEGDDASIDAAPWMTPRLRRYLRPRNYLNTMQLLVVRTSPAALIVAIETCGGRVTRSA